MTAAVAEAAPPTSAAWRFPSGVRGWLLECEGRLLADLARSRRVLEIGSYEGRSTICMAQTAEVVYAVDTFDGRATPVPGSTYPAFLDNLQRYGVDAVVLPKRGTSTAIVPGLPGGFGLAFIDGAHDYESVKRDARLAAAKLAPDGFLAFHDHQPEYPGVLRAVGELLANGWRLHSRAGTVAVLCRAEAQTLFLALPRRPGPRPTGEAAGKLAMVRPASKGRLKAARCASSLLCLTFNRLLALALNARNTDALTHFAMQHDDIDPAADWADVLIGELDRTGAAVCSAVVPLKDARGLTSTAVRNAATAKTRRLSMAEVMSLPETFTLADCHAAGITSGAEDTSSDLLAVNTGLWVCRLTDPWLDRFPGFSMSDALIRDPDTGLVTAGVVSEDWQFSEWLAKRGLRAVATRKVPLAHLGHDDEGQPVPYRNDSAWGSWDIDRGDNPGE